MQPRSSPNTDLELRAFVDSVAKLGWALTAAILDATSVSALRAETADIATEGRGGARNLLA